MSNRFPQLLRMMIFDELLPITKLTGDKLISAWLQCIRRHYRAWKNRMPHSDISLGNLMVWVRDAEYYGIVIDWDLANIEDNPGESRKDPTKLLLFTSLNLLRTRPPGELVVQRYVHDLESFGWILVWIFLTVHKGKHHPTSIQVDAWKTGNSELSRLRRKDFVTDPGQLQYTSHEEWRPYSALAESIATWLNSHLPRPPPKDDLEVFREFLQIIESEYMGEKPTLPRIKDL